MLLLESKDFVRDGDLIPEGRTFDVIILASVAEAPA